MHHAAIVGPDLGFGHIGHLRSASTAKILEIRPGRSVPVSSRAVMPSNAPGAFDGLEVWIDFSMLETMDWSDSFQPNRLVTWKTSMM